MRPLSLQFLIFVVTLSLLTNCKDKGFLETHWDHPLQVQNEINQNPSQSIQNFDPIECGTCHSNQWNKWKNSFHAKSIGNGFLWQKEILSRKEWDNCLNCHSPLPETKAILSETYQTREVSVSQKNHFPNGINNPSIQCASCHIRKEMVYGPPSRYGSLRNQDQYLNSLPHNGFKVQNEFTTSEFCKSCHESPSSGVSINGKRLMETYMEWGNSSFAKQGIQCQNCHMPDREHSWKGIHDEDFVRKAIETDWKIERTKSGELYVRAEFKSIAIGHKFPTYLIPKVYLRFYGIDVNGKRILMEESIIGRLLNTQLTEEYYDTRIEPKASHLVEFSYPIRNRNIQKVLWEIEVDPDEHYVRSFEESQNAKGSLLSQSTKEQIKLSLSEKKESRYTLFTLSLPVPVSLPQ